MTILNPTENKSLLVHIGMQRSASTFLQNVVFPNIDQVSYIGKTRKCYPSWMIKWHYLDDYCFDRKWGHLQKKVQSLLVPDQLNVISSESFCMYGGMYWNQAHRLKKVCPKAYILLVLRDPIDRLLSAYKYNVQHEKFYLSLEESIDWERTPFVFHKRQSYYLPDFYYDEVIELYRGLFGNKHVHILYFEDLLQNQHGFFDALNAIMGGGLYIDDAIKNVRKRVNQSCDDRTVISMRINNARQVAMKYGFMCGTTNDKRQTDEPLLPASLRGKLIECFKGRTAGYY